MTFKTSFVYRNREDKARYVGLKYGPILTGKILDVGADQGYLRRHLGDGSEYTTVGLEPFHDVRADLERGIPLPAGSYDCVLCLDVLEHVDHIHDLFDELCRVSRRYVVVALPNPWATMWTTLRGGRYSRELPMKFYALTPEPLPDRHRWFFAASEAKEFLRARGEKNGFRVLQMDQLGLGGVRKRLMLGALRAFLHPSIPPEDLVGDTVWGVLERAPR